MSTFRAIDLVFAEAVKLGLEFFEFPYEFAYLRLDPCRGIEHTPTR